MAQNTDVRYVIGADDQMCQLRHILNGRDLFDAVFSHTQIGHVSEVFKLLRGAGNGV